ncbi:MAG: hypothetical protein JWQ73_2283 [Variovorax sp.]|jgi:hypothetical protein|nr:hypothetical protein [Variovorax sp.]
MSRQAKSDARDNKRVFWYGVAAIIVVVLAAVAYNVYSQAKQPGAVIAPNPSLGTSKATPDTAPAK